MEPPYTIPNPKELTHRLRTNLLRIREQNRRSSYSLEPAQVEQHCNDPLIVLPDLGVGGGLDE
jgi:hypothetical protein